MKDFLLNLDVQILEGLQLGRRFKAPAWGNAVSKVIFSGMGGSAIGGDILRILVTSHKSISFKVHRTGRLPDWADKDTLVIFSSYSGNTPEILQNVDAAIRAGSKVLVLSSGGKLTETAKKKKLPYLQVPGGLPPRCAVGYMTFSLVPLFQKWGWLKFSNTEEREVLRAVRGVSRAQARSLAAKFKGRSVHFYGFSAFAEPVLTRWRAQLAENSKQLASSHLIPEMMHNEIEGWVFPKEIIRRSTAVFFMDRQDPAWLKKKMAVAKNLIARNGAQVLNIASAGSSLVARLFSLLVLGDWVSYELALLNKIDPIRIPLIEALKKVK